LNKPFQKAEQTRTTIYAPPIPRFTCARVDNETQDVLGQIDEALREAPSPPAPLPKNSD